MSIWEFLDEVLDIAETLAPTEDIAQAKDTLDEILDFINN